LKKTLVLLAILTLTLWSASYAIIGLGVRVGMGSYGYSAKTSTGADSSISESGLLFGAHVDFTALPIIGIEVSGTYWPKSKTVTGPVYNTKTTYSVISLEGTGKYKFSIPGSPITPYIGAGPGLYLSKAKTEWTPPRPTPFPTSEENSATKFGIHGAVGANLKLPTMPVSFGVQGKYALIFSDPSSHMLSIVGLMTYSF
jgi:opacity protein-like surface antigen